MTRFLLSISLIPLGLSAGILIRHLIGQKDNAGQINGKIRRILQITVLLFTNPVAFAGAVWALPLDHGEIALFPVLGVAAIALGGLYSVLYTRKREMTRRRKGSHFCVSYYTNIGSIGGILIYALLGEPGFMLLPFYKLLEPVMYFAVGFPVASRFGSGKNQQKRGLLGILRDPFVVVSMGGIFLGLILNMAGLPRPAFYAPLNSILVPLGSFLLLISIGIAMHFRRMKDSLLPSLSVLAIKFILVPLTITLAAYCLGMGQLMGGLPLKVVFVLSSMPAGFLAIMPSSLYKLDLDFANTAWLMTMIGLIPVIPWLYFSLTYLFPLLL